MTCPVFGVLPLKSSFTVMTSCKDCRPPTEPQVKLPAAPPETNTLPVAPLLPLKLMVVLGLDSILISPLIFAPILE